MFLPLIFLKIFFAASGYNVGMEEKKSDLLTAVERVLKDRFQSEDTYLKIQSTALDPTPSLRVDQLVRPVESRGKMPFTKDKYVVRENPHLVQWEREVRRFCRNLSLESGHRISATMIFEWATGIPVAELVRAGEQPNGELRKINQVLRWYFGKSYSTWIMGRKVPNCYKVKEGYRMKRHLPMTMTLRAEYYEGVLNP